MGAGIKIEFLTQILLSWNTVLIEALTHEQYNDASVLGNVEDILLDILIMLLCVVVWCGTNQPFISHVGTKLFLNVVSCTLVPGKSQQLLVSWYGKELFPLQPD